MQRPHVVAYHVAVHWKVDKNWQHTETLKGPDIIVVIIQKSVQMWKKGLNNNKASSLRSALKQILKTTNPAAVFGFSEC